MDPATFNKELNKYKVSDVTKIEVAALNFLSFSTTGREAR
jgi:hypothetical protein